MASLFTLLRKWRAKTSTAFTNLIGVGGVAVDEVKDAWNASRKGFAHLGGYDPNPNHSLQVITATPTAPFTGLTLNTHIIVHTPPTLELYFYDGITCEPIAIKDPSAFESRFTAITGSALTAVTTATVTQQELLKLITTREHEAPYLDPNIELKPLNWPRGILRFFVFFPALCVNLPHIFYLESKETAERILRSSAAFLFEFETNEKKDKDERSVRWLLGLPLGVTLGVVSFFVALAAEIIRQNVISFERAFNATRELNGENLWRYSNGNKRHALRQVSGIGSFVLGVVFGAIAGIGKKGLEFGEKFAEIPAIKWLANVAFTVGKFFVFDIAYNITRLILYLVSENIYSIYYAGAHALDVFLNKKEENRTQDKRKWYEKYLIGGIPLLVLNLGLTLPAYIIRENLRSIYYGFTQAFDVLLDVEDQFKTEDKREWYEKAVGFIPLLLIGLVFTLPAYLIRENMLAFDYLALKGINAGLETEFKAKNPEWRLSIFLIPGVFAGLVSYVSVTPVLVLLRETLISFVNTTRDTYAFWQETNKHTENLAATTAATQRSLWRRVLGGIIGFIPGVIVGTCVGLPTRLIREIKESVVMAFSVAKRFTYGKTLAPYEWQERSVISHFLGIITLAYPIGFVLGFLRHAIPAANTEGSNIDKAGKGFVSLITFPATLVWTQTLKPLWRVGEECINLINPDAIYNNDRLWANFWGAISLGIGKTLYKAYVAIPKYVTTNPALTTAFKAFEAVHKEISGIDGKHYAGTGNNTLGYEFTKRIRRVLTLDQKSTDEAILKTLFILYKEYVATTPVDLTIKGFIGQLQKQDLLARIKKEYDSVDDIYNDENIQQVEEIAKQLVKKEEKSTTTTTVTAPLAADTSPTAEAPLAEVTYTPATSTKATESELLERTKATLITLLVKSYQEAIEQQLGDGEENGELADLINPAQERIVAELKKSTNRATWVHAREMLLEEISYANSPETNLTNLLAQANSVTVPATAQKIIAEIALRLFYNESKEEDAKVTVALDPGQQDELGTAAKTHTSLYSEFHFNRKIKRCIEEAYQEHYYDAIEKAAQTTRGEIDAWVEIKVTAKKEYEDNLKTKTVVELLAIYQKTKGDEKTIGSPAASRIQLENYQQKINNFIDANIAAIGRCDSVAEVLYALEKSDEKIKDSKVKDQLQAWLVNQNASALTRTADDLTLEQLLSDVDVLWQEELAKRSAKSTGLMAALRLGWHAVSHNFFRAALGRKLSHIMDEHYAQSAFEELDLEDYPETVKVRIKAWHTAKARNFNAAKTTLTRLSHISLSTVKEKATELYEAQRESLVKDSNKTHRDNLTKLHEQICHDPLATGPYDENAVRTLLKIQLEEAENELKENARKERLIKFGLFNAMGFSIACGLTMAGAAIMLAAGTMFFWPVLVAAIPLFLFVTIANWWITKTAVPSLFLALAYDNFKGETPDARRRRRIALFLSVFAATMSAAFTALATYAFIFGMVALLGLTAPYWLPIFAIVIAVMAAIFTFPTYISICYLTGRKMTVAFWNKNCKAIENIGWLHDKPYIVVVFKAFLFISLLAIAGGILAAGPVIFPFFAFAKGFAYLLGYTSMSFGFLGSFSFYTKSSMDASKGFYNTKPVFADKNPITLRAQLRGQLPANEEQMLTHLKGELPTLKNLTTEAQTARDKLTQAIQEHLNDQKTTVVFDATDLKVLNDKNTLLGKSYLMYKNCTEKHFTRALDIWNEYFELIRVINAIGNALPAVDGLLKLAGLPAGVVYAIAVVGGIGGFTSSWAANAGGVPGNISMEEATAQLKLQVKHLETINFYLKVTELKNRLTEYNTERSERCSMEVDTAPLLPATTPSSTTTPGAKTKIPSAAYTVAIELRGQTYRVRTPFGRYTADQKQAACKKLKEACTEIEKDGCTTIQFTPEEDAILHDGELGKILEELKIKDYYKRAINWDKRADDIQKVIDKVKAYATEREDGGVHTRTILHTVAWGSDTKHHKIAAANLLNEILLDLKTKHHSDKMLRLTESQLKIMRNGKLGEIYREAEEFLEATQQQTRRPVVAT